MKRILSDLLISCSNLQNVTRAPSWISRGFITVLESMLFRVMNPAWLVAEFTLPDAEQRVVGGVQRFDAHLHAHAIAHAKFFVKPKSRRWWFMNRTFGMVVGNVRMFDWAS